MRAPWIVALTLVMGPMLAQAQPQVEDFVYDPKTDTYIFTYWGHETGTPVFERGILVPHTRIVPTVQSKIKDTAGGMLRYDYRLKNGKDSKQNLNSIDFLASHADRLNTSTPAGWNGGAVPNVSTTEFIISWFRMGSYDAGITPGNSQDGFAYNSADLPGISEARLVGAAVPIKSDTPGSSLPPPDSEATRKMEAFKAKDYVPRLVAAPKIGNPVPFSPAVVLANLQKHVKADMASMQLIDPALLALIDRGLTQAIAAAQGGNTPSLLHEIKSLRQLLKQEHTDVDQDNDGDDDDKEKKPKPRIAKLAAKVLDFDLKYVEKRI